MARRTTRKRCIGCGTRMPLRPTDKGWTISQRAAKGHGQRWYRQCGCLTAGVYGDAVDDLFAAGRDYWKKRPQPAEKD